MAARSHRFFLAFGPAAANTSTVAYTVPAGYRAVLRHIQIRSLAACTTLVGVRDSTSTDFYLAARVDAAAVAGGDVPVWIVYDPGDKMVYRCSVANNINLALNGVLVAV